MPPKLKIPMYAPGQPLKLVAYPRQSRQSESRIRVHVAHVVHNPDRDPDVLQFADIRLEMN